MIKRTVEELEAENAELRARTRRLEDYLFTKPAEVPAPSPADEALRKRLEELAVAIASGIDALSKALQSMPHGVAYVPPVNIFPNVPQPPTVNPNPWQPAPPFGPIWIGQAPVVDLTPRVTCAPSLPPGGVHLGVVETRYVQ